MSATPTIDVQSTGAVTVLTRETLEVVPSSRSGIISLMNQSPSVRSQLDVGGSQTHQLPAMRVYGIATQATSWLVLDGVVATDAGQTGGGGSYFDLIGLEALGWLDPECEIVQKGTPPVEDTTGDGHSTTSLWREASGITNSRVP